MNIVVQMVYVQLCLLLLGEGLYWVIVVVVCYVMVLCICMNVVICQFYMYVIVDFVFGVEGKCVMFEFIVRYSVSLVQVGEVQVEVILVVSVIKCDVVLQCLICFEEVFVVGVRSNLWVYFFVQWVVWVLVVLVVNQMVRVIFWFL